jgi:hypothetical protein
VNGISPWFLLALSLLAAMGMACAPVPTEAPAASPLCVSDCPKCFLATCPPDDSFDGIQGFEEGAILPNLGLVSCDGSLAPLHHQTGSVGTLIYLWRGW